MPVEVMKKQLMGEENEEKVKEERDQSGPRFGLRRPWLRMTCQLMKVKNWSCEDISNTATKAGLDMPVQFLKWKIESLGRDRSESPIKPQFNQLKKCMKKFLKSKNIALKEVRAFAVKEGFKMGKLKKFFECNKP